MVMEEDMPYSYEDPNEIIEKLEHIGDGIFVRNQYIHLGDGIYVEYIPDRPQIVSTNEGKDRNPDNNVRGRNQEDDSGDRDILNNAGSIY